MSAHSTTAHSDSHAAPLDLSKWKKIPVILIAIGAMVGLGMAFKDYKQFAFTYLTAYIFFLSLCVGGLFLTLIHHLFDAAWSTPLRRLYEHAACLLFPWMAILFIPIAIVAPKIYPWMMRDPHTDHALHAKSALLNIPAWYAYTVVIFLGWWFLTNRLRYWSTKQDETGSAECTHKLRSHSYWGIWFFALSVTLAIILWVKSMEYEWFSTMFGVYYFAESIWTTLATFYVIMTVLRKTGHLAEVITPKTRHDLGVLWFAFTVFYAYIHFSQYFIIWNANLPEETWRYVIRENGNWGQLGMLIIFGHFFLPFLCLLRIDAKKNAVVMIPLAIWAWLMHFADITYNIMPIYFREVGQFDFNDAPLAFGLILTNMAFIGGVLVLAWVRDFKRFEPYPKKDPRLAEGLGIHHY